MNVPTRAPAAQVAGRLSSMDLSFEVHLETPLFDLPERRANLLRALHRPGLRPFNFETDDVEISEGGTLSEFRMAIGLFDGKAKIEIAPETLGVSFHGLPKLESLEPCRQVLERALDTMTNVFPDGKADMAVIDLSLHVDLENERSASLHLNEVSHAPPFDFSKLGKTLQYQEIKFAVEDEADSWRVNCNVRGVPTVESRLNVSLFAMYDVDDTTDGLETHVAHLNRLIADLLPQIGVDLQ